MHVPHSTETHGTGPDFKPLGLGTEPRRAGKTWRWLAGAAVILILAAALAVTAGLIGAAAPAAELPLAGRIALLPFVDATANRSVGWASGWIETGLMEMVAETVSRTAGDAVVSPTRLRKALDPRGFDLGDPAARERARSLALASGADQVLDVTLTSERGEGFAIELELFDGDGAIAGARMEESDPLAAADALAFSLARGLSSATEPRRLQRLFSRSPFLDRLYASGLAELRTSSPETARAYFEIALRHQPGFFQAKARLVDCARQLGELEHGVELAGELIREAQARGERSLEARGLRTLAALEALRGQLEKASELYAQAYTIHVDMSDRPARAETLFEMARLALASDNTARAEELYVEMLGIQQDLGDRLGEADTMFQIGSLLLSGGDYEGAEQLLADSRKLAQQTNDLWTEVRVSTSLGEIALRKGELETAKRLWRRALGFYDQREEKPRRLLLSYKLAQALVGTKDFDEAENRLHDMRELAAELDNRPHEAQASLGLAWIYLRTGYPKQAKTHLYRALELDRWLDDRKLTQMVIAWYAYEQGNYSLAVRTQAAIKHHSPDHWLPTDEAFLQVFRQAELLDRRLPLPGEREYVEPQEAAAPPSR